jgi:hypothetical protein
VFSSSLTLQLIIKFSYVKNQWTEPFNGRYLGLPSMVDAPRSDNLNYLVEGVLALISVWKKKCYLWVGKRGVD